MEAEVFYSEFFRVTHLTRKRMIHNQLMSLAESPAVFTVGEQATIYGRQVMQRRVWAVRMRFRELNTPDNVSPDDEIPCLLCGQLHSPQFTDCEGAW